MYWDAGIDLGTGSVRLAEHGAGMVLAESASLAYRNQNRQPFATGDAALGLEGRTCPDVTLAHPLKDGTLCNPFHAQCMLDWAFRRSEALKGKRRYSALITCSPASRRVQMEALLTAAIEAGASDAMLVRSDAASAVGAGLDILSPQASMILDLGAGSITAALFTMGRVADFNVLPYGMSRIDEHIRRSVRTQLGYSISLSAAGELKHAMGAASERYSAPGACMTTAGLDMSRRLPAVFSVSPDLVVESCLDVVREAVGMAAYIVENAPAELAADLNDSGIVLTGGGAHLPGLDQVIGDALGIPCSVATIPEECAVRGLHRIMQDAAPYKAFMADAETREAWR